MVVGIRRQLDGRMPHHLRHGGQVSALVEQGGRKQVPQVVHPGRVGDPGPLTGILEGLPNCRQPSAHVLDDIPGHRFLLLDLHALQEVRVDRDRPVGLGLARIDPDGAGSEVDIIPLQGQEFGLPRTSAQVEADLHGPFEMGFGVLHDLPGVVQGQAQIPGLDLGLFPVLQRVDPGEAVVHAEVEDEAQVVAVLVDRVLGPRLAGARADALEVQNEWDHVPLVGQGVDRLVADDGDELVVEQTLNITNVLLGPAGCSHVIQVLLPKFRQGDAGGLLFDDLVGRWIRGFSSHPGSFGSYPDSCRHRFRVRNRQQFFIGLLDRLFEGFGLGFSKLAASKGLVMTLSEVVMVIDHPPFTSLVNAHKHLHVQFELCDVKRTARIETSYRNCSIRVARCCW